MFWNDYWKTGETGNILNYRNAPDLVLLEYLDLFKPGNALDMGMGEGRNAFFLAGNGFHVDGYDVSRIAVERCSKFAKQHNLSIAARVCDINKLVIPKESYDLIVLSMVIYFFRIAEIRSLMRNVVQGLKLGGFIYLSTMATSSPSYLRCRKDYEEIEKNTFYLSDREMVRHYAEREEIQEYLSGLQRIYFAEVEKLDITHDDPHYHSLIECLAQKARAVESGACGSSLKEDETEKRSNP
jgi:2-polyprenyl-3-methyl-5-hydroxy-6-metoxy-1,4-benzoquinol methylase